MTAAEKPVRNYQECSNSCNYDYRYSRLRFKDVHRLLFFKASLTRGIVFMILGTIIHHPRGQ